MKPLDNDEKKHIYASYQGNHCSRYPPRRTVRSVAVLQLLSHLLFHHRLHHFASVPFAGCHLLIKLLHNPTRLAMQSIVKKLLLLVPAILGLVSCQSGFDMRRAYTTSPDAVVSINQVDPAYRVYFREQHGSNFSLADQRKAFAAAVATARTPVPRYMPASVANPPRKKASRSSRYLAKRNTKASRRATVKRGRVSASRRSVAKRGKSTTNKRLARNSRNKRRR